METRKPLRRDGILARKIGDEWLLYDSQQETIHVLNTTAEAVWWLCDGGHSVADMEAKIRDRFQVEDDRNVAGDINSILLDFDKLEILSK